MEKQLIKYSITIKKLNDAQGKLLLQSTKINYAKEILISIKKNPELLELVCQHFEKNETQFLSDITDNLKKTNITELDTTLSVLKKTRSPIKR